MNQKNQWPDRNDSSKRNSKQNDRNKKKNWKKMIKENLKEMEFGNSCLQ